ncbi:MAG TPA: cysteine rich repeat-containing protein [Stellaceae bacterium]
MHTIPKLVVASALVMIPAGAMAQVMALRQACGAEIQQLCAGIEPGEGRLRSCVKDHFADFSETCKQAMLSNVALVKACKEDVQKTCAGVQPGGGRIQTCMKEHFSEYSDPCKRAIVTAKFGTR